MSVIKMILTNGFAPDPRVYKEAKTLVREGFDVEVLCWDRENMSKGCDSESKDGIKIKRFFPYARYGSGIKQVYPFFLFIKQLRQYLITEEIDIIHAHDIDGMMAATFINGKHKLIWDMHEFYDGSSGTVSNIYKVLAPRCFKKADAIIFVSEKQRERYDEMICAGTETALVMNAAELELFKDIDHVDSETLRIAFIGSVRDFESLKMMIDLADSMSGIKFFIHGGGYILDRVTEYAENKKNVIITGAYRYEDAAKLYAETDLVYSVYSERVNVEGGISNKFFETIAAGVPIVGNDGTYNGALIKELNTGFVIKAGSTQEMRELINRLKQSPEELCQKINSINLIKDKYLWHGQEASLIDLYKKLII